ncbi:MAG: hypothetical protein AMXMBFR33_55510 [Candidatus Xenobia bacterium]|jgi:hypothetical protein
MIRSLWIGEVENPAEGNTDLLVTLEDGRTYAFTAFTPGEVQRLMKAEGMTHFVCEDLLLVSDLSEATLRRAAQDLAENHDLDRYGIRQQAD